MELSERKKRILYAIVNDYIQNAEPVGSKAIAEQTGIGLSSATIRNEMSELESLGYLEQPHTSAGRIPTQKGYRLFVNDLMEHYKLSAMEMQRINDLLQNRATQLEKLIADVGRQISGLMNLTTVAVTPKLNNASIKRFDFIPIDSFSFVLVVVTSGGIVKNKVFRSTIPIDSEVLFDIGIVMNNRFTGIPIESITLPLISQVQDELQSFHFVLMPILQFISDTMREIDSAEVYLGGAANILEYPEFQSTDKVKNLFSVLDNKDELKEMMAQLAETDSEEDIKIVIGKENPLVKMQDSSIVIGNYKIGEKTVGVIGVIGPTRMNYGKVAAHLEYFTQSLNKLLNETFFGKDKLDNGG
ncbi:MAG: heat-inducible transcriptional repressor HrcA [Bacillota bacterium]|nr:heat-inducible transcriptional repressor HrcA [Bacillota bacterium]